MTARGVDTPAMTSNAKYAKYITQCEYGVLHYIYRIRSSAWGDACWPYVIIYNHIWPYAIIYDHIWSCIRVHDHIRSCMILYGHVWSCKSMCDHILSYMVIYDQLLSYLSFMIRYDDIFIILHYVLYIAAIRDNERPVIMCG